MFDTSKRTVLYSLWACLLAACPTSGGHGVAVGPPMDNATRLRSQAKAPRSGDEAAWSVSAFAGPTHEVTIDTDEGTWMSLDVSPDGQTIVFDLLGDIYAIPATGGPARALRSGLAWEIQPRFSPDGAWIAFTSDHGGGDNIWVMRADGSEARAVTDERFRLLNSPAWTPDGQYIAARKHYTNTRSLGAGEIWLYHVSGGTGVQLTERPNFEQDVGEPALSPDGRVLYYSQDTTPGPRFQYNKDPHAGIYSIFARHLDEQRTERLIDGPGGAVRPTPSPDGKKLAYVGRHGLKTSLWLFDLASGKKTELYDDLDRDMQETWAIHGAYPTMAWTPDSSAIVFWAGGRIHRLDIESGKVAEIPFQVKDTRTVIEALRYPVAVHPERFDVKMLRWVETAPDGKSVVYQALGHLYIKSLPDGTPRRVTRDDDVFEHYPSFSRDGKEIVYVAWNDTSLGEIRTVPVSGGKSRAVTKEPGHYVEPRFSPDGAHIVYRKTGAGGLLSPDYSRDPGIYLIGARGGEPRLVRRGGSDPHFGAASDRVFFTEEGQNGDKRSVSLMSIGADGTQERSHLTSEMALLFRVSPNGRWVAWQEQFSAFMAPFPLTGKAHQLAGGGNSLPVVKVGSDAGNYLHWSGDGQTLHWSLGPELFSRSVGEAFPFLSGTAPELAEPARPADQPDAGPDAGAGQDPTARKATRELPPAVGVAINFATESDKPVSKVALVGGRVVTMKGDTIIDDGVVVVVDNRITEVGARGSVTIPPGAHVVDIAGKTVLPGLVDVHAHGPQSENGVVPQQSWLHLATLAFGVTTVHDPSNQTSSIFAAAELARAGLIVAPRIFSTGTILYGATTPFTAKVDSLEDARFHLRRMKAVGAFSVKSYNQPRRDQRQQLLTAARELEMMVVPEGGSLYQHNMNMVVDGHTGIEHSVPIGAGYRDMAQLWSGTEVQYTPTLVVGYGGLMGEYYWYQESDVFAHPRLRHFVPPHRYEGRARRRLKASEGDWNHVRNARLCKKLLDAGVAINLGAHGQREGLAAHWEIWSFVQGGMSPFEALRAATIHSAQYLGLDRDIGSIEPGKLADLFVVDGDPLADIRQSDKIEWVMINGRLYQAETMKQVHPEVRNPAPGYWE